MKGSDGLWIPAGENNSEKHGLLPSSYRPTKLTTRCKVGILAFIVLVAFGILLVISFVQTTTVTPTPTPKIPFTFKDIFGKMKPTYSSVQWLAAAGEEQSYAMWANEGLVTYTLPGLTRQVVASYENLCGANSPLQCSTLKRAAEAEESTSSEQESLHMPHLLSFPSASASNYTLALPFTFSPNKRFVMFATDVQVVYRHSTLSTYILFDTQTSEFTTIAQGQAQLNVAVWSPSVSYPQVAYVQANDLYVFDVSNKTSTRVTTSGAINQLINGMCDWVYEEEIFSQTEALWWSPDGMYLAFLRFDESDVPEINFPYYALPDDGAVIYKYPKSGQNNSIVSLSVFSVASNQTLDIDSGSIGLDTDGYIIEVMWFGNETVACKTMPRLQNRWVLWSINASTGSVTNILEASHQQYLEAHQALHYLPNTNEFVDITIENGFKHLAVFSAQTGNRTRLLTGGDWEVQGIFGINRGIGYIYFTGTFLGANQKAVFAVELNPTTSLPPTQLSCGLPSVGPRWDTAQFSPNGYYYVFHAYGENSPGSMLCAINTEGGLNSTVVSTLTNNSDIVRNMSAYALPAREFVTIPAVLSGGNRTMRGQFLYPSEYVPGDCSTRYPVLVHVYGGPGAQLVTSQFPIGSGGPGFHSYLSSIHKFIIFTVDPVGTGGLGDEYQKAHTYGHLGVTEAEDIVGAVAWLKQKCFVSGGQVALWGWSYGGFMSSKITSLGLRSGLAATIAVAPVTDWRLYDSVYTERYMRTPALNWDGYNNSSVLDNVSMFSSEGPNYFLIHGTGDDNVHFQNSALLVEKLVEEIPNYDFSSFYYPNRAHGLVGPRGENNQHLYRMLARFLLRTLQLPGDVS